MRSNHDTTKIPSMALTLSLLVHVFESVLYLISTSASVIANHLLLLDNGISCMHCKGWIIV